MTLPELIVATLKAKQRRFAVIGAAAMAIHGVSRSTLDLDFFTTDQAVLLAAEWTDLPSDVSVDRRFGDHDDPLAGLVRIERGTERPIDLIVGHGGWQEAILERARPGTVGGVEIAVASLEDLILLKLFAGGPQDLLDVVQLLASNDSAHSVIRDRLAGLPPIAAQSWKKVELLLS